MHKIQPVLKTDKMTKMIELSKPCYLVAQDGAVFLTKENSCFRASINVTASLKLQPHDEELTWKLPPIPCRQVHQAISFLRFMMKEHRSEGLIWVYYSHSKEQYLLYAPSQTASRCTVSATEIRATPDDFLKVGTIHSHPGVANHSAGDDDDERHFDGVHVTIGNLMEVVPSFSCSVVVSGKRFILPTDQMLDVDTDLPLDMIQTATHNRPKRRTK